MLALAWEMWRRGRNLAWLAVGIIAACSLSARLASDKTRAFENFMPFYYLLMIISLALVFGIFHNAEFNPRKNWHGFPYRLFTLPVPTWVLVGCPMLLGVVSVELVYFAWAQFVFEPLGSRISLWPAAVLGVGLPCYQALVWSLAGFRITRLVVLALAGMLFMDIGALPAFRSILTFPLEKAFTALSLLLVGLAGGAIVGGWFSVERQRRGGGRGRGWFQAQIGRMLDALPRRRREFASPAGAQFWFEWRRAGLLLPVCTGAALILIFAPVSWFTRRDSMATLLTLAWALVLPVILALVIGQGFGKPDFWSGDISLPPFLAVRPLAEGEIVVTKMKVALMSTALAWLPVLGFLALWLPLWANTLELREWWTAGLALRGAGGLCAILTLCLALALMLTWRGMVGGLWVGLSGSKKQYVAAMMLQIVAAGFAIWSVFFFLDHFDWKRLEQYVFWLQWALALAIAAKLWLAVFSWRKISPARTGKYALIWAAGTAVVVALGWLVCPNVFWLKPLVIMAALLPFPLARLGLAPGALERNRHRS
jgi:hypothetical protein